MSTKRDNRWGRTEKSMEEEEMQPKDGEKRPQKKWGEGRRERQAVRR
jgi:hypothetical protein